MYLLKTFFSFFLFLSHCLSVFSGFLRVAQQVYLIEPLGVSPEGDHAVYKPQHLSGQRAACGLSNGTEDLNAFIQPKAAGVFRPSGQVASQFHSVSRLCISGFVCSVYVCLGQCFLLM